MNLKDFALLKKVMGYTMSPNDGEALNALRHANRILTEYKLNWEQVLDKVVKIEEAVEPAPPEADGVQLTPDAQDIRRAFTMARKHATAGFVGFLDSLERQWHEKGSLSSAQREALFRAAKGKRR